MYTRFVPYECINVILLIDFSKVNIGCLGKIKIQDTSSMKPLNTLLKAKISKYRIDTPHNLAILDISIIWWLPAGTAKAGYLNRGMDKGNMQEKLKTC